MVAATSTYPKFSLVLYFNAETEKGNFPGQITVQDETAEGFETALNTVVAELVANEADAIVNYKPREVSAAVYNKGSGGGGSGSGGKKVTNDIPSDIPECPIHNAPLRKRSGQYGIFYSCGEKNPDGSWCNWKPPTKKG